MTLPHYDHDLHLSEQRTLAGECDDCLGTGWLAENPSVRCGCDPFHAEGPAPLPTPADQRLLARGARAHMDNDCLSEAE